MQVHGGKDKVMALEHAQSCCKSLVGADLVVIEDMGAGLPAACLPPARPPACCSSALEVAATAPAVPASCRCGCMPAMLARFSAYCVTWLPPRQGTSCWASNRASTRQL